MSHIAQFRPPDVIRDDAALVEALRARDSVAIRRFVERFGGPARAALASAGAEPSVIDALIVASVSCALAEVADIDPTADLAVWFAGIVQRLASERGSVDSSSFERGWCAHDAVASLDSQDRLVLRAIHRGAQSEAVRTHDDAVRSERGHQQLARRLRHLPGGSAHHDAADGWTDAAGLPTSEFATALGPTASLLATPMLWDQVPSELVDRAAGGPQTDVHQDREISPETRSPSSRWPQARSMLLGAGLAILLLAAGIVTFSATGSDPAIATFDAELVPTGLVPDVNGRVEITELDGGLRLEVDAVGLPPRTGGSFYAGWLVLDDERVVSAGTFQRGVDVNLFAGIELERVAEFLITRDAAAADGSPLFADDDVVLKVAVTAER